MDLFDVFKKNPPPVNTPLAKVVIPEEKTQQIIDEFKRVYSVSSIKLIAKRGNVGLTDSKFGGQPYFPKNMEYPCDKAGKPLRLLAQLNFGELPKLENFPQKGILQFFIAENDHYGADFDNMTVQDTFRVVYHIDILPENELAGILPELSSDVFPFSGEFALTAEIEPCCLTNADYRFDKNFAEIVKKYIQNDTAFLEDYDDDFTDTVYEATSESGHRIGGFPKFTQWDPRSEENPYDTLLLQIDSEPYNNEHKYEIIWGDLGVANFFINSEDLAKLDFSNVLYTWDCC